MVTNTAASITPASARSKKATFNLSAELLGQVAEAVEAGVAPSKNAFVERAIAQALEEVRREARRHAWEAAARDPLFLRDIQEIEIAFRSADAETARGIG